MNNFSSPFLAKNPLKEKQSRLNARQGVGQETNKHQSTDGNASLIEVPVNSNSTVSDKTGYYKAMIKQNDSLRALPKDNLNHLPTFDITTDEGQAAKTKFYTQDSSINPDIEKLGRLQKMARTLRSKYGL